MMVYWLVLQVAALFIGHVTSQACNSIDPVMIQGLNERASSPAYPNNYNNSLACLYNVTVPAGHIVKMIFLDFTLPSKQQGRCPDYVMTYNAASTREKEREFCGSTLPAPVYARTNSLKFKFFSDDANPYKGFSAMFEAITEQQLCPQNKVLSANSGVLTTPFYPSGYPGNKTCSWRITAPEGKHVKLQFLDFDIQKCGSVGACTCDYVKVAKGTSINDRRKTYCQTELNIDGVDLGKPIYSVYNNIWLTFHSDDEDFNNHKGFNATYELIDYAPPVCPAEPYNFTDNSGSLSSPYYPANNYPSNTECSWDIAVSSNLRIKLNFTNFEVEDSGCNPGAGQCNCDWVRVYDGTTDKSGLLGVYCGSSLPSPVVSSGNRMLIKFYSGPSTEKKGFHLVYTSTEEKSTPTIKPITTSASPTSANPTSACNGLFSFGVCTLLVQVLAGLVKNFV